MIGYCFQQPVSSAHAQQSTDYETNLKQTLKMTFSSVNSDDMLTHNYKVCVSMLALFTNYYFFVVGVENTKNMLQR